MKKWLISICLILSLASFGIADFANARGGSSSGGSSGGKSSSSGSSWGSKSSTPSTGSSWGSKRSSSPTSVSSWGKRDSIKSTSSRAAIVGKESRGQTQANYVKSTTSTDWNKSRSTYTAGKTIYTPRYTTTNRTPEQHTVIVNRYHNSYGGYYYGDPFNHSLIWTFSTLWWFNHWNEIDRARYADDAKYKELEAKVRQMEAQGTKRDANYKDPNMDEGVMYSDGYLNKTKAEGENSAWGYFLWILLILGIAAGCFFLLRMVLRRNLRNN